jgi:protein ATS1
VSNEIFQAYPSGKLVRANMLLSNNISIYPIILFASAINTPKGIPLKKPALLGSGIFNIMSGAVLFALGSNGSGQLGIGHKEDVSVPKQVIFYPNPPESPIVKVAAGGNHTLLLTESGHVWWSGDASSGASGLPHEDFASVPAFQELQLSHRAAPETTSKTLFVAATWEASFLVKADSESRATKLFSFGTGLKGELGTGEMIVKSPSATLINDFPPSDTEIVDIAACMGHVVAVLSNGDVYGWGNGRKGQLGDPPGIVHSPRQITGVHFKATRAACGRELTCLFGEPSSGKIQVLGSDKWSVRSAAPETIPEWKEVGSSWGNVYILKQDGSLLSWGRDDHGQLPPPNLPAIQKIAIGSEHVVAISESGDVLSWGWGEHGNCGPQVDHGDVRGRFNIIASSKFIPPDTNITSIGAGCATSWVFID